MKSNIRKFDEYFNYQRFNEAVRFCEPIQQSATDLYIRIKVTQVTWFMKWKEIKILEYGVGLRGEYTPVGTYLYNSD